MTEPLITTDPSKMDVGFIHTFITNSYWASGRTKEEVQRCMEHSLNFGLFSDGKQVGYGRVVTDTVSFAYIMDVFIDPAHRGKGYSLKLMDRILNEPLLAGVKTWRLATTDAHGLYEKFGFGMLEKPGNMMEMKRQ